MTFVAHPIARPETRWTPPVWCFRSVAAALAVAVSGRYGLWLADLLGPWGGALLGGAAAAWAVLLGLVAWRSPGVWRWPRVDWCVWTMTVGSVVMAAALLAVAVVERMARAEAGGMTNPVAATLLGGLLVADAAMAWVLTRNAPAVGMPRPLALLLWLGGMNGFLAAFVIAVLLMGGGR